MIELAEKTDAKIEFIVNPILLAKMTPYNGVVLYCDTNSSKIKSNNLS